MLSQSQCKLNSYSSGQSIDFHDLCILELLIVGSTLYKSPLHAGHNYTVFTIRNIGTCILEHVSEIMADAIY